MGQYVNKADLNDLWAKVKADFTHSLAIDGTDLKLTRELHIGDPLAPTSPATIYNLGTISRSDGRTWLGLGTAAYKNITDTYSSTSSNAMSGKAVAQAINSLPTPMQFKGSVGTGGTVEWANLPTASSSEGYTYKVITAHSTAPICEVGDTIVSNGTDWVVIPSGDEPSGTVTSVGLTVPTGLSVSGSPITTSGTIAITLASGYMIPGGGTAGQVLKSNGTSEPSWVNQSTLSVGSATKATQDESGNNIKATYAAAISISDHTITLKNKNGGSLGTVTTPDTKNTAGSTDTSSKIYLIGATSQGDNPQTYSDDQVTVTNGNLEANKFNSLTLTAATTGFTIAGGTTSKTLTVNKDITLNTAAGYDVLNNATPTAATTGQKLITERTLYYALPSINNSHTYKNGEP